MMNNQIFINETSLCNQQQCSLFQFSTSSIFFDSDVKAIQDSRLHIIPYVHDGLYLCFSSSMEVFKQSLSLLDLNTQTS